MYKEDQTQNFNQRTTSHIHHEAHHVEWTT